MKYAEQFAYQFDANEITLINYAAIPSAMQDVQGGGGLPAIN